MRQDHRPYLAVGAADADAAAGARVQEDALHSMAQDIGGALDGSDATKRLAKPPRSGEHPEAKRMRSSYASRRPQVKIPTAPTA
jgi:hypothetical protein